MDWFMATFSVMMLVGLSAVLVPAYWLASGWWRDRGRRDEVSVALADDVPVSPSFVHILTAGEALAQPNFGAAARGSLSRERPDERPVPLAAGASNAASFVRIPTAGEALSQPIAATTARTLSPLSGSPWRSRSTESAMTALAPGDG
jgi:hypothetical protein